MTSAAIDIERPTSAGSRALFVATICTGSFLLFLVQPMIARMALPRLGGAPAVWNSAMLVYQALLLAGYAYAHWLARRSPRGQAGIHLLLFALGTLFLPIGLAVETPSADANPVLWVPYLLVTSIGPLFLVVAAQAPLMQRWFALSGGRDPYPLYAASNLGSFGGLIAYPLLVEPLMTLPQQRWLWTFGYVALAALVGICALRMPARIEVALHDTKAQRPALRQVARWIILAAVPSGLMLSTTTHLTTDIVAMPLLWVVPLALYLLSFSVAFAENQRLAATISRVSALCLLIGGGTAFMMSATMPWAYAALGLALLFVISVTLHSALYAQRPEPSQLTGFYLAMSAGGVLGGVFCALVAPLIFDWGYEHPILLAVTALLIPQAALFPSIGKHLARPKVLIAVAAATIALSIAAEIAFPGDSAPLGKAVAAIALAMIAVATIGQRILFTCALSALALTLGGWSTITTSVKPDARTRSYFGINTVGTNPDGTRYLLHGTTLHGLQLTQPGRETTITKYFGPGSGIGMAMPLVPSLSANARVGLVGLGAGTLACYARPGQNWRLYEIDPAVVAIARNPRQFSFLERCLPKAPMVIGDARLTLGRENAAPFDMLILDAFSADTIPIHMLTIEAFDLWARKVTPSGLLMVQISNRFMDLEPVLASQRQQGWHGVIRHHSTTPAEEKDHYTSSTWVALSRHPDTIARLTKSSPDGAWRPLRERAGFTRWTDQYATILPLLNR